MHRTDMHIAIPPRPSPLSQDSTSSLSSSDQSSSSTTSFVPAPGRCIHRPLDRPPTPYPGECQLCLASEHVGAKGKAEPLGALVEEEEEPSGASSADAEAVAGEINNAQEELVSASSSCAELAAGVAGASAASTSSIASEHIAHMEHPPSIVTLPQRKRRPSWFKRFLSTDILASTTDPSNVPAQHVQTKTKAATATPLRSSISEAAIAQNIAQPTTTQVASTQAGIAAASRTRQDMRMSFASTTLMPTLDYSYTVENSAWKAPPVVGPMAKRKQVFVG